MMRFSYHSFLLPLIASLSPISFAASVSLPSYPLAVKGPYLSTWVPGDQLSDAATAQPEFWAGQNITWTVLARVNGATYSLFGLPGLADNISPATTKSVSYTSTHTYITVTADVVTFNLDFFSPVLPGSADDARQSLPYSYLTVNATSTSSRSVQVLSAIDDTWTGQNGASSLNYTNLGSAGYYQYFNPRQTLYTENADRATYGSIVFGASTDGSVTHGSDSSSNIYSSFVRNGALAAGTSSNADTVAWAKNLGTFQGTASSNATFVVGFDRVYAINYLGEDQTGYYRTKWQTIQSAVTYALSSYGLALAESLSFDVQVRSNAEAVSDQFGNQYADIVEASVRQTFGALELTVRLLLCRYLAVADSLQGAYLGPYRRPVGLSQRDLK